MTYGYIRVSSNSQNIDRQLDEMYRQGLEDSVIFIDRQSGKDFNRCQYQKLKKKLKANDLLIVHSIDRFGRNYEQIIEEWNYIVNILESDILVIDFPLLDTRIKADNIASKFISDIVLQLLSFVAQTERENIRQRQAEGIKVAKARGIQFGRPHYAPNENYQTYVQMFRTKKITASKAAKDLNISRSTFYKYIHE